MVLREALASSALLPAKRAGCVVAECVPAQRQRTATLS